MWLPLMSLLSPSYHCIAMEFRGFGGSTLDGDYTLSDLAQDVEIVRSHFAANERMHLVGLSMGGYVALEYWRLFSSNLRSLILSNTKPDADDSTGQTARRQMAQRALESGAWSALAPMLPRLIAPQAMETEVENNVRQMMQASSASTIAAAQHAMAGRKDFTQIIETIRVPTLVVTGQYDFIAPPQTTRQWAHRIPSSSYSEIATAGHLAPLENPEDFHDALERFFSNLGAS